MHPTDIHHPDYFHKVVDFQRTCPAHAPVPEYILLIAAGRRNDAYRVNWPSNVFPGNLGRTCDRPCEPACRRRPGRTGADREARRHDPLADPALPLARRSDRQRDRLRAVARRRVPRRHADHRPFHCRGHRPACARGAGRTDQEGSRGMTYLAKPNLHYPILRANQFGLTRRDYEDRISTLSAGCGHPSISAALIQTCWSSTSSRTASPSSRGSAARRRRPTAFSATRTASTPCTAACPRS